MKRIGIFMAAVMAAGALWAAAPSVTINSVQQRYPWNNKIDVVYTLELDKTHAYGLKFKVWNGDNAVTNTVATDLEITPAKKLTSYVGTNTIDLTGLEGFNEVLAKTGPKIAGVLIDKGWMEAPPDPDALDEGDGVTFVPGDYLVLDLTSGAITTNKNVQTADAFQDNMYKTTKMVFRKVPVGSFHMQAQVSSSSPNSTGTVVRITNEYYIAIYQCTQKQWSTLAGSVPSGQTATGDTIPVAKVSWNMIAGTTSPQYITALNTLISASGYQAALPNEAQWERASRAGANTQWFFGSSDSAGLGIGTYAWYTSNASSQTHEVGTKSPNAWGLYDVYGNVWEWCQDWNGTLNYSQQPGGPSSGSNRVFRGGSYYSGASFCSSVLRSSNDPSDTNYGLGFRLLMTLK